MSASDILAALLIVMDQEHADGLVSHRRSLRKPLTLFAAQMLIKEYKRFGDANLAVEEQVLRGWVGFKSEWCIPKRQQPPTPATMFDDLAEFYDAQSQRETIRSQEPRPALLSLPSISRH